MVLISNNNLYNKQVLLVVFSVPVHSFSETEGSSVCYPRQQSASKYLGEVGSRRRWILVFRQNSSETVIGSLSPPLSGEIVPFLRFTVCLPLGWTILAES